jgi:Fe-S cluster assembly ATP-binding protein
VEGLRPAQALARQAVALGLFLAFQYPTAVPGLSVASFIRSGQREAQGIDKNPDVDPTDSTRGGISMLEFRRTMREKMALLKVEDSFAARYVNDGFSGGEKKRLEMLQMAMLTPSSRSSTRPIRARHRRPADRGRGCQRDAQSEHGCC